MAEEKLEYPINIPIRMDGYKESMQRLNQLENKVGNSSKYYKRVVTHAQSSSARFGWTGNSKPGTMGRTFGNVLSKNIVDLLPTESFSKVGEKIGTTIGKKIWGKSMSAKYAEAFQLKTLAQGKSLTSKTALLGVDKAAKAGSAAAGAKGAAMGSSAGAALGTIAMGIAVLVPLIVASSRMLQRTLGNIMKYLLMFLRPIGDILAVLFYPLMMVLRPMALLINTMLRPFLKTARDWYRLGLRTQRDARVMEGLGFDDAAVKSTQDMADYYFSKGTSVLGLGLSSFMSEIVANILGGFTTIIFGAISLFPGLEEAANSTKDKILHTIDVWKEGIQTANLEQLYKSQQELSAAQGVVANIESWIGLVGIAKANGDDYKKIIAETSPMIQTVAEVLKSEGAIAALSVAENYTNALNTILTNTMILNGETKKYWGNQLLMIDAADKAFKTMFANIQTKIDALTGNDGVKKTGNIFTQIAGLMGGIGLAPLSAITTALQGTPSPLAERSLENANMLASGYGLEQVFLGQNMNSVSSSASVPTPSIDTSSFVTTLSNISTTLDTNTNDILTFTNTSKSAFDVNSAAVDSNTLMQVNKNIELSDSINTFINSLTQNIEYMSTSIMFSVSSINASLFSFSATIRSVISAIDSALTACKNAEMSAKAAAADAKKSNSGSSGIGNIVKGIIGSRATGGSVSENGVYYLHKGETVVNPVASSFTNSNGSSGSLPPIEFNNCTFGGVADWKKEMDKYFNTQMRHIR